MNDWIVPEWPAPKNVRALFTTRNGGKSSGPKGIYATLNLGDHVKDNPKSVAQNRSLLRNYLPTEPKWLKQVHGVLPIWVDNSSVSLIGDAAMSRHSGIVCAVLVADCLPIFLCDSAGTMVGVIHAGWRGLARGIIEQTVMEMNSGHTRFMAWLGPAIGPNNFEVGEEVLEAFVKHDKKSRLAFAPHPEKRGDKWLANIFLLARQRLATVGITDIYSDEICTYSNPTRFFSYRRDGDTGRMAALIWLTP
ncbi:MAG: peptidoglycan editing factor PgeF [Nitrosomonas sp.]|nr:peptidoglycan editing factor PgeF [Nitrosomonas sp.]